MVNLDGTEVALTDWLLAPTATPTWVPINLNGVDRIVIESQPRLDGGGWFGMDNFTYQVVPESGVTALLSLSLVCMLANGDLLLAGRLCRLRDAGHRRVTLQPEERLNRSVVSSRIYVSRLTYTFRRSRQAPDR